MPSADQLSIRPGDVVLERYRVVEQIASGGHSVVYRGTDERLSRPVCIKVFSGLGGQSGVGRTSYEHFVQEAFALSRLTHPNTLRIYDFGHLGSKDQAGMPLQVCEYMNGGTLSELVRAGGSQPIAETARVITAMCAALAEAHGLGIVHRDIKPQNILFGIAAGTRLPKLADFGIAKWSTDESPEPGGEQRRAEDTQIVAGQKLAMYSPSWAAPEQLSGQTVSAATDIYSLAVVAVYMLSSKAIFADEDVYAGYKKRRHAERLLDETLAPLGISAPVIAVLGRALAFDPKKRLRHVDELADELAVALEPTPESRPPTRAATAPTEPSSRPEPPANLPTGTGPRAVAPIADHAGATPSSTTPSGPSPSMQSMASTAQMPALSQAPAMSPTSPTSAMPAMPQPAPAQPPAPAGGQGGYQSRTANAVAWMLTNPAPTGVPYRLALSDVPVAVGDRRVQFAYSPTAVADLTGPQASRLRVTLLPGPEGLVVHLKGMSCFVAPVGGRPSPAVQLTQTTDVALVSPRVQELGHVRVATAVQTGPVENVFALGAQLVSVAAEDCADPILFDFGPGMDAYFVYTRGRVPPKSRRG